MLIYDWVDLFLFLTWLCRDWLNRLCICSFAFSFTFFYQIHTGKWRLFQLSLYFLIYTLKCIYKLCSLDQVGVGNKPKGKLPFSISVYLASGLYLYFVSCVHMWRHKIIHYLFSSVLAILWFWIFKSSLLLYIQRINTRLDDSSGVSE